ncbi:MAG: hypothetical protein GEV13_09630 [Rhodospirillales bacterium]|nr:hypothetical protein [Rhodospirillales bacterium]
MSTWTESTYFPTVTVGDAKIRFVAVGRTADEGDHDIYVTQLPDRPLLYGEWRARYARNGNDFDIEVLDFGLIEPRDFGIPSPLRRLRLDRRERTSVQELVVVLFANEEARNREWPFSGSKARFLGQVFFASNWILV